MQRTCMFLLFFSLIVVFGCEDGGESDSPTPTTKLYVEAGATKGLLGDYVLITVRGDSETGTPIADATVTINSVTIPLNDASEGQYLSVSNPTYSVGDTINLSVIWGSLSVSASIIVPEEPFVTAPTTAGGPYDPSQTINVQWQALTVEPNGVIIVVDGDYTASGVSFSDGAIYGSTTYDLPTSTLDSGLSGARIRVVSTNFTNNLGTDAALDSVLFSSYYSTSESFATQ